MRSFIARWLSYSFAIEHHLVISLHEYTRLNINQLVVVKWITEQLRHLAVLGTLGFSATLTPLQFFLPQLECSLKTSPSWPPSNPKLVSSPSCCPSTTSSASSSSAWRSDVLPSSFTKTRQATLRPRSTLCSAPSTWLMESECKHRGHWPSCILGDC